MLDVFYATPGLLFVVATLLPIASFLLILLASAGRAFLRSYRQGNPAADAAYQILGGDVSGRGASYVALAAIALACVFSVIGFVTYLEEHEDNEAQLAALGIRQHELLDTYHHA